MVNQVHFFAAANHYQGEIFKDTKTRLSKRIGIKGKQFDKIKFAVIQRSIYAKPIYLTDGRFQAHNVRLGTISKRVY